MKSKFKIIGGTGLIFFLLFFIPLTSIYTIIFKGLNPSEYFFAFSIFIAFIFTLYETNRNLNRITFEHDKIVFKNIIFQNTSEIFYKELDGFIDQIQSGNGGSHEVIYLKKKGVKTKKISSFYHSNYLEMKKNLKKKVKYLGYEPFRFFS